MADGGGKTAFICPTTHWDREWVMTFGQFRVRLVGLFERLLTIMERHEGYAFYLDGQAAMLDDYLDAMPESRGRVEALMRSGRLVAGPWYVLADQFLEGGESTVRNLLLGSRTVAGYGGVPAKVGYVPDSFGSVATLPMVLRGFGIDCVAFGRGRPLWGDDLPHTEFWWECPDGSRAFTVNHGYGNGSFLSYPDLWSDIIDGPTLGMDHIEALSRFMEAAGRQEKASAVKGPVYLSVGADHMEPRGGLVDVVGYINGAQDSYELVIGTIADYVGHARRSAVKGGVGLRTYRGEMYGTDEHRIFEGTLSTHMGIKALNDRCESLLARELEPLCAMASMAGAISYPKGLTDVLWKSHLLNHAHDSICCCSVDAVIRDIRVRGEHVMESGSYMVKDALHSLVRLMRTDTCGSWVAPIAVFNPLGHDRDGHVRGLVRVPRRVRGEGLTVVDGRGKAVGSSVRLVAVKNKDLESVYMTNAMLATVLSKDAGAGRADDQAFSVLEVDFVARAVPSMGYRAYGLAYVGADFGGSAPTDCGDGILELGEGCAENEYMKVSFNGDGTFDAYDKLGARAYGRMGYLADREEAGDTYRHLEFASPDERDSKGADAPWRLMESHAHKAVYAAEVRLTLPASVCGEAIEAGKGYVVGGRVKDPDGVTLTRSAETGEVTIGLRATLYRGLPYLEVEGLINNVCKDHCLRLVFDTRIKAGRAKAYDHFNIMERPLSSGRWAWRNYPFTEFVRVEGEGGDLCVSVRGQHPYEAAETAEGTRLYVEVLRSTGTVGDPAGANHPAKDALSLGESAFSYALYFGAGADDGRCLNEAVNFRNPLVAESGGSHGGRLPECASFLRLDAAPGSGGTQGQADGLAGGGPIPYISCLKRAERGDGYVLRLWNPGGEAAVAVGGLASFKSVTRVGLDESPIGPESPDCVRLPAKAITSLLIEGLAV